MKKGKYSREIAEGKYDREGGEKEIKKRKIIIIVVK